MLPAPLNPAQGAAAENEGEAGLAGDVQAGLAGGAQVPLLGIPPPPGVHGVPAAPGANPQQQAAQAHAVPAANRPLPPPQHMHNQNRRDTTVSGRMREAAQLREVEVHAVVLRLQCLLGTAAHLPPTRLPIMDNMACVCGPHRTNNDMHLGPVSWIAHPYACRCINAAHQPMPMTQHQHVTQR